MRIPTDPIEAILLPAPAGACEEVVEAMQSAADLFYEGLRAGEPDGELAFRRFQIANLCSKLCADGACRIDILRNAVDMGLNIETSEEDVSLLDQTAIEQGRQAS